MRLAGVFVFEFVVVLLGVVAAQAVADWADDRRLGREAAAQFQQARAAAIQVAIIQHHWRTVSACLGQRAQAVARAAANGEPMTAAEIGRPALPATTMPVWDPEVRRAAIARYTPLEIEAIEYFENRAMILTETTIRARDGWSTFAMLDPANGPASAVDRGNVRLAAISVVDHMRLLGYADPAEPMAALGVAASEWQRPNFEPGRIDACGLLNDWRPQAARPPG